MWLAASSPSSTSRMAAFCNPALEMSVAILLSLSFFFLLLFSGLLQWLSSVIFFRRLLLQALLLPRRLMDPALNQAPGRCRFGFDLFGQFFFQCSGAL